VRDTSVSPRKWPGCSREPIPTAGHEGSRRLVRHLRAGSANPVFYAELPGAQHGFDAVQSPRYLAVVAALRRFTEPLAG
jgi:hypothetical protein